MSQNIYIVGATRTPLGSFQGALASIPATQLGASAIKGALNQAGVKPEQVSECIMGQVLQSGSGQAPARQAAIYAGLPHNVSCMTVHKVCGSGMKAIMLGADSIKLGQNEIVVCGGQENMSSAPHLLENSRNGYRMGHAQITDSMIKDGLWDPYSNSHMGTLAEICAKEYQFSREAQDAFAIESYKRAQSALANGNFKNEITPVEIVTPKATSVVDTDEEPNKANFAKLTQLRPAFDKVGTITAANASKVNDGAAAVVLASENKVKELKLKPLAKILAYASFSQDPKWFTTAPVGAIKKALTQAQLTKEQIDLWEINEAFAVVTMAAIKDLGLSSDKVNVNGGAIALGHPIGASGARILTTLTHALQARSARYGLATLCIGGGEGVAVILERV